MPWGFAFLRERRLRIIWFFHLVPFTSWPVKVVWHWSWLEQHCSLLTTRGEQGTKVMLIAVSSGLITLMDPQVKLSLSRVTPLSQSTRRAAHRPDAEVHTFCHAWLQILWCPVSAHTSTCLLGLSVLFDWLLEPLFLIENKPYFFMSLMPISSYILVNKLFSEAFCQETLCYKLVTARDSVMLLSSK